MSRRLDGLPKGVDSEKAEQLGAILDYCLEVVPETVAAWAEDVRSDLRRQWRERDEQPSA